MEAQIAEELRRIAEELAATASRLAELASRAAEAPTPAASPAPPKAAEHASLEGLLETRESAEHRHLVAEARLEDTRYAVLQRSSDVENLNAFVRKLQDDLVRAEEADDAVLAPLRARLEQATASAREAHLAFREAQMEAQVAASDAGRAEMELEAAEHRLQAVLQAFEPFDHSETSVRELVVAALRELAAPATSAELATYIRFRFGREIETNRFGPLRRDEERAYVSAQRSGRNRPVWLVPGLHRDGSSDRRYFTRSDWDLGRRCTHNAPEARLFFHLLEIGANPPRDTADPLGLVQYVLDESEELGNRWDDSLMGRQAALKQELAPIEAPDEYARDSIFPNDPDAPWQLRQWARGALPHQVLFGADHELDLDDPPPAQPELVEEF